MLVEVNKHCKYVLLSASFRQHFLSRLANFLAVSHMGPSGQPSFISTFNGSHTAVIAVLQPAGEQQLHAEDEVASKSSEEATTDVSCNSTNS